MNTKLADAETLKLSISCDRNWKRMTRPRFCDVVREIWGQLDDLGNDLNGAIIFAMPKGASPRQVVRAIKEIWAEQEKRGPHHFKKSQCSESPVTLVDVLWTCHKGHKFFSPEKPTVCPECLAEKENVNENLDYRRQ